MPKKTHTKQYQNHLSDSTHFVMKNLTADTSYLIKLSAQNELGMGKSDLYHSEVRTLKSDPTYVPDLGKKNMLYKYYNIHRICTEITFSFINLFSNFNNFEYRWTIATFDLTSWKLKYLSIAILFNA